VIVAWLLFPLVMLVVCLGCGLALQWASGGTLPGGLVLSLGLAVIMVLADLMTAHAATAPLATPLVLIVAVAGYALERSRLRALRPDRWQIAAGLGVFLVCAAPLVLTGNATFLGYFVLNDGIFHFALITQLLSHGHDLSRLPVSAYSSLLSTYLGTSYPVGADLPIGVLRPLVGQDVAWLFQPYLAVMMGLGAVSIYELLRGVIGSRPLRTLAAFVAGQAGLLYAYYLEASIKEVATTWIITVTVVLVFSQLREKPRWRSLIPVLIVAGAGYALLGATIAPWVWLPLLVYVLVNAARLRRPVMQIPRQRRFIGGAVAVIIVGGLAAVVFLKARHFADIAQSVLTEPGVLGNLVSPLPKLEMFGIWPNGDFRFGITSYVGLSYVLIGVVLTGVVLGTIWAIRRRHWAAVVLIAGDAISAAYLLHRADPYAAGKVMMTVSLASILAAMLGAAALNDSGRRVEGWLLALVVTGGVLWTNALGYSDASVAPRDRLQELSAIDARFDGQGPTFYNLSDEYAAYFLRDLAPTDVAIGNPGARSAAATPEGRQPWDPDDLTLSTIENFRLLVIGDQALASRPPSNYRLVYQGRFYDVWKRTASPQVLAHFPLGGPLYPSSPAPCTLVRSAAAQARKDHALLAYDSRPHVPLLAPALVSHPPNWGEVATDPYSLTPREETGVVRGTVTIPTAGRYQVQEEGDISQKMTFAVDGRTIGALSYDLGPPGQMTTVATVTLSAGTHTVTITRPANNLTPGDGGTSRFVGPVVFLRGSTSGTVSEIAPSRARELCGRTLDWIEIVR
jgi:hypothetical protein